MNSLLEKYGSFRRLVEAYWFRQLTATEECAIEDSVPKELLASFKPVDAALRFHPKTFEMAASGLPEGRSASLAAKYGEI